MGQTDATAATQIAGTAAQSVSVSVSGAEAKRKTTAAKAPKGTAKTDGKGEGDGDADTDTIMSAGDDTRADTDSENGLSLSPAQCAYLQSRGVNDVQAVLRIGTLLLFLVIFVL